MIDLVSGFLGVVATVLLDNCSSLYDCWDNVAPAAAAAVGAGAAAVLAGGLLLNPEAHEGPVTDDTQAAPPTQTAVPSGQPQVSTREAVSQVSATSASQTGPSTAPLSLGSTTAGSLDAAVPMPPLIGAVGGAIGTASVVSLSHAPGRSTGRDDDQESEEAEACPEADASLFGLPDNNTRQDCSSSREGLGPDCTGIDFTSNDERGQPGPLPFEACVPGTVSFVGGSYNMVEVTLENGSRVQYLHASEVYVRVGEQVGSTTRIGITGGTGPGGPNQYEPHLHIQALDAQGNLIDPDCALAGEEDRTLKGGRRKKGEDVKSGAITSPLFNTTDEVRPERSKSEPAKPEPPKPPLTMPPFPLGSAMVVCGNCGTANAIGSAFCGRCGKLLAHVMSHAGVTCSRCGTFNPPNAIFCGRCGTRLHPG